MISGKSIDPNLKNQATTTSPFHPLRLSSLIIYIWLFCLVYFTLSLAFLLWIGHSISLKTILLENPSFFIGPLSFITTFTIVFWLSTSWYESRDILSSYRSSSFIRSDTISWVRRVGSDNDKGNLYLGTRYRSVGNSSRWQVLSNKNASHVLLIGDNRVDWWNAFHLEQLLLSGVWGNSVIIIDPEATQARAQQLGTWYAARDFDTQCFMPYAPFSNHLNLLEGASEWEEAQELAAIVLSEHNPEQREILLLATLFYLLANNGPVSLGAVTRLLKNKKRLESLLLNCTERTWAFDDVPTEVYERLTTHLAPFDDPNLDRWSVPSGTHSNIDVHYGASSTFVYAGIPIDTPGRGVLLKLVWRALSQQLLNASENLVNPILLLPKLETYGHISDLRQKLTALKEKEVSVCASLPSVEAAIHLYGEEFSDLEHLFQTSLRFPRYARPSDIERFRTSRASLEMSPSHSYAGDFWQRLNRPKYYEPLLVPQHQRKKWGETDALLQQRGELPSMVSLPPFHLLKECDMEEDFLRRLAAAYSQTDSQSLETLLLSRKRIDKPALAPTEAGEPTKAPLPPVAVQAETTLETVRTPAAEAAMTEAEESRGAVPAELVVDVTSRREPISLECATDNSQVESTVSPTLGTSLDGEPLTRLRSWVREQKSGAVEVFDSRLWDDDDEAEAATYFYQRRSFAICAEALREDDLAWLSDHGALERQLTLPGYDSPAPVVVVSQELAAERRSLAGFIREHLDEIEGSAPYQKLDSLGTPPTSVLGRYYPRLILVQLKTLKAVLEEVGETPLATLNDVRLRVGKKTRRLREIVLDDAPLF